MIVYFNPITLILLKIIQSLHYQIFISFSKYKNFLTLDILFQEP